MDSNTFRQDALVETESAPDSTGEEAPAARWAIDAHAF